MAAAGKSLLYIWDGFLFYVKRLLYNVILQFMVGRFFMISVNMDDKVEILFSPLFL
jgi:hypothetical protein